MYTVRPPFIFRFFSQEHLICAMPPRKKSIYLTFDDGPVPEATAEVLEILKRFDAQATFFCVGENVKRNPDLFARLLGEGHSVGNHTYNHVNGWMTPPGSYVENVNHCRELVQSRLFRPPYGRFTPTQYFLLKKEYRFVMWSVLSGDFDRRTTPEQCLRQTIARTCDGSIVVFHDSIKAKEKLLFVLPRFLEHFTGLGYRFEAI